MNRHTPDIITIGTSAGGVDALKLVVRGLPSDLPAAVFIVMHLPPRSESYLPAILERESQLAVSLAGDQEPIEQGRIYIAPPDHHLLVANDHVHLTRGPKEARHRPAINVTFRSAAMSYGPHVVGVVMTGMLDDGTAGLWEIKARGGITVVQTPEDAAFPSMPMSAIQDVDIDYQETAARMPALLTRLVQSGLSAGAAGLIPTKEETKFSGFTCPECRGPVWQIRSKPAAFRCRVGHTYSSMTLIDEHTDTQERKLYEAVLCLEEGADLSEYMAARTEGDARERLMLEAEQIRSQAATLRRFLAERRVGAVSQRMR